MRDLNGRTCRGVMGKKTQIDVVHRREIIQTGEKNGCFHNVGHIAPCGLQYSA